MVELASLNMVELAPSLNMVVDRLVHACWNRLFMAWWTNRLEQRYWNHHDKSTAIFIHGITCCQGMNEITRLNSDVTTTMHLVVVSNIGCCIKSEQPLSIHQALYNMLKHDWIILLFYQSCSAMLTVLLQGCWANNPVINVVCCVGRVEIQIEI